MLLLFSCSLCFLVVVSGVVVAVVVFVVVGSGVICHLIFVAVV